MRDSLLSFMSVENRGSSKFPTLKFHLRQVTYQFGKKSHCGASFAGEQKPSLEGLSPFDVEDCLLNCLRGQ
jgi:hypothetical protein